MEAMDETAAVDLPQPPTNEAPTEETRTRWVLTDTMVPPPASPLES